MEDSSPTATRESHSAGDIGVSVENRHPRTQYKFTAICDFCPESDSGPEKSFKAAEVFKRHLTFVHDVNRGRTVHGNETAPDPSLSLPDEPRGECNICKQNDIQNF